MLVARKAPCSPQPHQGFGCALLVQRWEAAHPTRLRSHAVSRLQVVFVSTEVAPWSKTGGLGDVVAALPASLASRGHQVMTVSPRYADYPGVYDTGLLAPVEVAAEAGAGAAAAAPPARAGPGAAAPAAAQPQQPQPVPPSPGTTISYARFYACQDRGVLRVFVDHPVFRAGGGGGDGGGAGGGVGGVEQPARGAGLRDAVATALLGAPHGDPTLGVYTYCNSAPHVDLQARNSVLCQAALAAPVLFWHDTRSMPNQLQADLVDPHGALAAHALPYVVHAGVAQPAVTLEPEGRRWLLESLRRVAEAAAARVPWGASALRRPQRPLGGDGARWDRVAAARGEQAQRAGRLGSRDGGESGGEGEGAAQLVFVGNDWPTALLPLWLQSYREVAASAAHWTAVLTARLRQLPVQTPNIAQPGTAEQWEDDTDTESDAEELSLEERARTLQEEEEEELLRGYADAQRVEAGEESEGEASLDEAALSGPEAAVAAGASAAGRAQAGRAAAAAAPAAAAVDASSGLRALPATVLAAKYGLRKRELREVAAAPPPAPWQGRGAPAAPAAWAEDARRGPTGGAGAAAQGLQAAAASTSVATVVLEPRPAPQPERQLWQEEEERELLPPGPPPPADGGYEGGGGAWGDSGPQQPQERADAQWGGGGHHGDGDGGAGQHGGSHGHNGHNGHGGAGGREHEPAQPPLPPPPPEPGPGHGGVRWEEPGGGQQGGPEDALAAERLLQQALLVQLVYALQAVRASAGPATDSEEDGDEECGPGWGEREGALLEEPGSESGSDEAALDPAAAAAARARAVEQLRAQQGRGADGAGAAALQGQEQMLRAFGPALPAPVGPPPPAGAEGGPQGRMRNTLNSFRRFVSTRLRGAKVVFTVHNFAFQGLFAEETFWRLGLPVLALQQMALGGLAEGGGGAAPGGKGEGPAAQAAPAAGEGPPGGSAAGVPPAGGEPPSSGAAGSRGSAAAGAAGPLDAPPEAPAPDGEGPPRAAPAGPGTSAAGAWPLEQGLAARDPAPVAAGQARGDGQQPPRGQPQQPGGPHPPAGQQPGEPQVQPHPSAQPAGSTAPAAPATGTGAAAAAPAGAAPAGSAPAAPAAPAAPGGGGGGGRMVSWLRAALLASDMVVTVSPGYAREIAGEGQGAEAQGQSSGAGPPAAADQAAGAAGGPPLPSLGSLLRPSPLPAAAGLPPFMEELRSILRGKGGVRAVLNGLDSPPPQRSALPGPAAPVRAIDQPPAGLPGGVLVPVPVPDAPSGERAAGWDPATDRLLAPRLRYGPGPGAPNSVSEGKARAKAELQAQLGLAQDPAVPLFGFVGRLDQQKGVDVILAALPQLLRGAGEPGAAAGEPGNPSLTADRAAVADAARQAAEAAQAAVRAAAEEEERRRVLPLQVFRLLGGFSKRVIGALERTLRPGRQPDAPGPDGDAASLAAPRPPPAAPAAPSPSPPPEPPPPPPLAVQVALLGTGDQWLQDGLARVSAAYPGRGAGVVGFNEPLAHLLLAGCDFLLLPSRWEPCGLVALAALRYGTVPLVAPTGGLPDVLQPRPVGEQPAGAGEGAAAGQGVRGGGAASDEEAAGAGAEGDLLGLVMDRPVGAAEDSWALREAVGSLVRCVGSARRLYDTPGALDALRARCMAQDVSWDRPAAEWEQLLWEVATSGVGERGAGAEEASGEQRAQEGERGSGGSRS